MMSKESPLLLTVTEAAERLGLSRSHCYTFIRSGELPTVKLGAARRVSVAALADFVAAHAAVAEAEK